MSASFLFQTRRFFFFFGVMAFALLLNSCASSTQNMAPEANTPEPPQESVTMSINDAVVFDFVKQDNLWKGILTIYTLGSEGEKTIKSRYQTVHDSTLSEFDLLVNHLHLYSIAPQHELDGWVPDSEELPKRVYRFEVFDGDTTRTFAYQDPETDLGDYWQAQNILIFAAFVQDELRWKRP